jgi:hypothetical protein
MSHTYDLKEELILWAKEYGQERTAESGAMYYGFDFRARKREQCLVILIQRLKELGAEKGTFKGGPTRNAIVEFCLRPKHTYLTNARYTMASICVEKELERALLEVYGSESEHYKKHGTVRIPCTVHKTEAELQYDIWYAEELTRYNAAQKDRASNPVLAASTEPPVPPRKWEEVKKDLIASGQLVEGEYEYKADAEVFAALGIKL